MSIKINRNDIFVRDESGPSWFNEFLHSFAEQKEGSAVDILNAIQKKKSETVQGVVERYREMVGLDIVADADDKNTVKNAGEVDQNYMSHLKPGKYIAEEEGFMRDVETGERAPAYLDDIVCKDCNEKMPLGVKKSAAGYFLGRSCNCGPYSRESGYFGTREDAENELKFYQNPTRLEANIRPLSIRHAKELDAVSLITNDPKIVQDIESLCEHSGGTKNTHSIINYLREKLGKDISYSDKDLAKYIEDVKKKYMEQTEDLNNDVGRIGLDNEENPDDAAADYIEHGKGI